MKKRSTHKAKAQTPAQLQEQRERENAKVARAIEKCGLSVRGTFVRAIKEAVGCDTGDAETRFDALLKSGEIALSHKRGGVNVWGAKKNVVKSIVE